MRRCGEAEELCRCKELQGGCSRARDHASGCFRDGDHEEAAATPPGTCLPPASLLLTASPRSYAPCTSPARCGLLPLRAPRVPGRPDDLRRPLFPCSHRRRVGPPTRSPRMAFRLQWRIALLPDNSFLHLLPRCLSFAMLRLSCFPTVCASPFMTDNFSPRNSRDL